MKQFHFVYITTNLINGKQYVGDHSTNDLEKDKYLGSGTYFVRALNEYKKENFKKEILEFLSTKKEAFDAQEKYIIQYNTLTPNGYNISPRGGHNVKDCFSEETLIKLSKVWKGRKHTEESKLKNKESLKNWYKTHIPWNKGIDLSKEKNPMYGKHHKKDSIEKMKKAKSGKNNPSYETFWICNIELKQSKKINKKDLEFWLKEGWMEGRKMFEKYKYHGKLNTCWIRKNAINKLIKIKDLDFWLKDGWIKGRKMK